MKRFKERFIGDRAFYKMLLSLVLPLIIQQGITSFVNLLDNVMVGGLGTEAISAVAIVNQIIMVFNLAIFGGLSGASIFSAQFFGKKDMDGVKQTFRFKLMLGVTAGIISIVLFIFCGENFIKLFLTGDSGNGDIALTLREAKEYLAVMLVGLIPFALVQTYTGTLRESGETKVPMIGSTGAILINLALNYCLIFGHFGCPELGVKGAAIATIIARFFELFFIAGYTHLKAETKFPFMKGVYKSLYVSKDLVGQIVKLGFPLLANEVLWSFGMTLISQCYSTRGLEAVAAVNITNTIWNLFSITMIATGNGISILVGQKLGEGDKDGARVTDNRMLLVTIIAHLVMGGLLCAFSGVIPMLYNIEPQVRQLSTNLLLCAGLSLPIHSVVHAFYFTLRTGGKTVVTFFFDCVYTWVVSVALAYCLAHFTDMPVLGMYACLQFIDIVKVVIGAALIKSDFWLNNIVNEIDTK
ncbi:MAG: MATE family efflux transporter [Clostridia bacterium]|nr:MATE family efflux transporter [Clostridia bacterium]